MQETLDWHVNQIGAAIVYYIGKQQSKTRKVQLFVNNIPPSVFDKLFLKHNHTEWRGTSALTMTVDFFKDKSGMKWVSKRIPCEFMEDQFHFGKSFHTEINGEAFEPYGFGVTYNIKHGKLLISFHIRWQCVGAQRWIAETAIYGSPLTQEDYDLATNAIDFTGNEENNSSTKQKM